ncbi:MAG TPA: hypothetical protein PLB25_16770, partial [Rhodoferax sp.]|nr:hypothetical protein [Rhodoferax sp.]
MAALGWLLALAHISVKQVKGFHQLATGNGLAVGAHGVAVIADLVKPDPLSHLAFDKQQDRGFWPLAAFAHKQALRQADDGLQIAFLKQGTAQGAGAVLIPSQKALGHDDGANTTLLQGFQHQLDKQNGGLGLGGVFAPDIRVRLAVALRPKRRVCKDDGFAARQNVGTEFLQRIALLNVAGVEAAHKEIDR